MAVTSPVDIELCAVAVYQCKAWFNEGAKKPTHTHSHVHTHACTHVCTHGDKRAQNTRGVFHSSLYLIPILLSLIIPLSFGLRDILCLESAKL